MPLPPEAARFPDVALGFLLMARFTLEAMASQLRDGDPPADGHA